MSPLFERGEREGLAEYRRDAARGRVLKDDTQIAQRGADILNARNFSGPTREASEYTMGFIMGYTSQSG
jgi:hypothetical protein